MKAPEALLAYLQQTPGMESGSKRLVLLFTQLGDFDSMEYAQALVPELSRLEHAGIKACLLYTSPSPRDRQKSRMPSSA